MNIDPIYTARSTATGGGLDGQVKSLDGLLDLRTRPPKEMGGSGEGVHSPQRRPLPVQLLRHLIRPLVPRRADLPAVNPELLFSAGYATSFLGALRLVATDSGVVLDAAAAITVQVGIGRDDTGYGLTTEIIGYLPGLDSNVAMAMDLMKRADQICPYSKATRGRIQSILMIVDRRF